MSTTIACVPASCARETGGHVVPRVLTLLAAGTVWFIVCDCLVACAAYVVSKSGPRWSDTAAYAAGHALGLGLLLLLWRSGTLRRRLDALLMSLTPALHRARGLVIFVALLTVLRVAWVFFVPTQPTSDSAVYHGLAARLAQTGVYDTAKHRAYWPPGYPAFLALLYTVCGPSVLTAKLSNVALAALADLLTWRVVRNHAGARAAAAALLLTALWPGRNLHVDVLSYDELALALVLASFALLPRSVQKRCQEPFSAERPKACFAEKVPDTFSAHNTWAGWATAGFLLGLACLVRPTLGLIPLAVGGWLLVRVCPLRRAVSRTAVYGLAMLIPIVPWTIRNYVVLHRFVPLTTNAGGNFYNSWAPGGTGEFYKPAWDRLLAATGGDEAEFSPTGFAWGLAAIRSDPAGAAWRVVQKQVHYLGSDNWLLPAESYIAAFGGQVTLGTAIKLGLHTLTNAWYVLLLLTPLVALRGLARPLMACPLAWLGVTLFAMGLLTHTVFEAQARYHLVYLPFWSIALALLLTRSSCAAPVAPSPPAPYR